MGVLEAITLLVTLSLAIPLSESKPPIQGVETVYEWKTLEFDDLPQSQYADAGGHKYYIRTSVVPTGMSYHTDSGCLYFALPRRAPGNPAAVAFVNTKETHYKNSPHLRAFPTYEDNYIPGWFGVDDLTEDDYENNIYPDTHKVKRDVDESEIGYAGYEGYGEVDEDEETRKKHGSHRPSHNYGSHHHGYYPSYPNYPKPSPTPPPPQYTKPTVKLTTPRPTYKPKPTYTPAYVHTQKPTHKPTYRPTYKPTYETNYNPPFKPTHEPTYKPTYKPTQKPIYETTYYPPYKPTYKPTEKPVYQPPYQPSYKPKPPPTTTPKPTYKPPYKPPYSPPDKPYVPPYKPPSPPSKPKPTKPSRSSYHFTSVYFTQLSQKCSRLFFVDTGTLEYPEGFVIIRRPVLWAFDVFGCDQKSLDRPPVLKVTLPDSVVNDATGLFSFTIDVYGTCNQFSVYMANSQDKKIVVYDNVRRSVYYFQHETFYPEAEKPFIYDYDNSPPDTFNYGVLGITMGRSLGHYFREVYYAPGTSLAVFKTSSQILRDEAQAPGDPASSDFAYVGYRGPDSQVYMDYHEGTQVLFFIHWNTNKLTCWNTNKPLIEDNVAELFTGDLQYGLDMAFDGKGNIWFMMQNLDYVLEQNAWVINDYYFRLYRARVLDFIKGTVCEN